MNSTQINILKEEAYEAVSGVGEGLGVMIKLRK